MTGIPSIHDSSLSGRTRISVHVSELRQLFNAMDPSPFRERDLDAKVEQFIVEWARDAPRGVPLELLVHLDQPSGSPDESGALDDAVRVFFEQQAASVRNQLRQLMRRGRVSLVIGLVALAASIGLGDMIASVLSGHRLAEVLRESLLIGGWVAMWRPLEVFLYDWWPIRAEARLYDRLAAMPVRIEYRKY